MKLTMALAVFLGLTAWASGQGAVQPPTPQSPQAQVKIVPEQQQQPKAKVLPNWPSDKPAPIILIPTEMPPQKAVLVSSPNSATPTTTPSSEK